MLQKAWHELALAACVLRTASTQLAPPGYRHAASGLLRHVQAPGATARHTRTTSSTLTSVRYERFR